MLLVRKWTVYVALFGFLVGFHVCLVANFDEEYRSEAPSTIAHTVQVCGTSVLFFECENPPNPLRLTSSLSVEQHTHYEGITLTPPFPPPRG